MAQLTPLLLGVGHIGLFGGEEEKQKTKKNAPVRRVVKRGGLEAHKAVLAAHRPVLERAHGGNINQGGVGVHVCKCVRPRRAAVAGAPHVRAAACRVVLELGDRAAVLVRAALDACRV
jgi:hypothetical protein